MNADEPALLEHVRRPDLHVCCDQSVGMDLRHSYNGAENNIVFIHRNNCRYC
jgi:hypothetical protein